MIVQIKIPKGWRVVRGGRRVKVGDAYINPDSWIYMDEEDIADEPKVLPDEIVIRKNQRKKP